MTSDLSEPARQAALATRRDFARLAAGIGVAALVARPAQAAAPEARTPALGGAKAVNFERGSLYRFYDLNIDPDVLIDMLADWGQGSDYLPAALNGIIKTAYAPGSQAGRFPCTRRLYVTRPGASREYYEETMLSLDAEARTAIYRVDGIGPAGCRNYVACVEVTDLGNGRSRMAFRTRFDLPPGGSVDDYVKRQEGVYQMMASGLEQHAAAFVKDRRAALAGYRAALLKPALPKDPGN